MFCIYEVGNDWVAELVDRGKLKLTARGKTPIAAIESLFIMIGEDNDESGTGAVESSTGDFEASGRLLPPNCS